MGLENLYGRLVGRDAFDAPQVCAPWLARGGYRDKTRIAPYGLSFQWRDGMLHGITVLSRGELRPNIRTLYFPQPFDAPLAVVPSFNWRLLPGGVSNVFWHAVSPSNSLVVTWENSPVNRDVNSLTNFQAELFADGSFVYRYDDRTVGYALVFSFDWDDDGLENSVDPEPLVSGPDAHGTNAEWYNVVCSNVYEAAEGGPGAVPAMADTEVGPPGIALSPRAPDVNTNAYYFVAAAAFPDNAAEIAAAGGYAAWAAQRASDPNRRLIGLGVASPDGRWPICVEVGGVPVMADGRAELLYALDCGAQVPFSLSDGALGAVTVSCAPLDVQTFTLSNLQTFSFPCECMIGDVTLRACRKSNSHQHPGRRNV